MKIVIRLSTFAVALLFALQAGAASRPTLLPALTDCGTPGKDGDVILGASGPVNTYFPPANINTTVPANTGGTTIDLGPATGTTGITAGDLLLIIQMQDAGIDTNNDERYGDGSGAAGNMTGDGSGSNNLANVGFYEYVTATNAVPVGGGTVSIEGRGLSDGLLRTYVNAAATGTDGQKRFQVIRVPQYGNLTINGGVTVIASAWNGASGGIVVFDVRDTFTNNGTVSANALGFRGGASQKLENPVYPGATNLDYSTISAPNGPITKPDLNANKGEGIAGTPRFVRNPTSPQEIEDTLSEGYPNGSRGRGAPGNAGGGGNSGDILSNNLNSGGGGGGNGGKGGKAGRTGGTDPGLSNIDAGGHGGAAFPAAANRVVMGGGGGSGSKNDNSGDGWGGRGGGIIMIRTGTVAGAGTITANGETVTVDSNDNGGGGSGAGGSIVLVALSSAWTGMTVTANGGNGGNAVSGPAVNGPGGGGGGGVILLTGAASSATVSPGLNGTTTAGAIPYGATPGLIGVQTDGTTIPFITPGQIPGVGSGAECSSISISDVTVDEGAGTITFIVTVPVATAGFTVNWATANGTATAGNDYTAASGPLTIPANAGPQTVNLTLPPMTITDDSSFEVSETFIVNLSNSTGLPIGDSQGIGTITDNDSQPSVSWAPASQNVAENVGTVTVTASLSEIAGVNVTVPFTLSGTAVLGQDYLAPASNSIVIQAGQLTGSTTFTVIDDNKFEGLETVVFTMGTPTNASPNPVNGEHQVNIQADGTDPMPVVKWTQTAESHAENVGTITVTALLNTESGLDTIVPFTVGGTALAGVGNDFTITASPITITAETLSATVTITVNDDGTPEAPETIILTIGTPIGATVAPPPDHMYTATINDNDGSPTITFDSAVLSVAEGDAGQTAVTFIITLTPASGNQVTVDFTTQDGTATASSDYVAASGSGLATGVVFDPGETQKTVVVQVNGDVLPPPGDPTETFDLVLSNPTGGAQFPSAAASLTKTATITTDDIPTDLSLTKTVDDATPIEGQLITFTITIGYVGSFTAPGVTVVDLIPPGLTFVGASLSKGSYDPVTGIWTVGDMANGDQETLTLQATVDPGTRGSTFTNQVTIGSGVADDADAQNNQASVSVLVVIPDLQITTLSPLPNGSVGNFYSQTLVADGGLPNYQWSLAPASTPLPAGLGLNPATGEISGTPSAPGTFFFDVLVVDAQNPADSDTQSFAITINTVNGGQPPVINALPDPPGGMVGVGYSHAFTATNAGLPYTWSLDSGSLPDGLSLSATGMLTGTPTLAGTFNFTLEVAAGNGTDTQDFSITVVPNPVRILTTSLPPGTVGSAYNQLIDAAGGVGPTFTWSVVFGAVPPGLEISGTGRTLTLRDVAGPPEGPLAEGTYIFTLRIVDTAQPGVQDEQTLIVLISPAGTLPVISTADVPNGTVGDVYLGQLTGSGGQTPYTWTVEAGNLPPGLTLDPNTGTIGGTPTQAGVFEIIVQLEDSNGEMDTQELTITIGVSLSIVTSAPTPTTPDPLNSTFVGQSYFAQIQAVGGIKPYVWTVSGALPGSLTLSSSSGAISGVTSGGTGTFTFDITVTDANGVTDTQRFSIVVEDLAGAIAILTKTLPPGVGTIPYSHTLLGSGGTPATYQWSIISLGAVFDAPSGNWSGGGLPGGIVLNQTTGALSGSTITAGDFTFEVQLTDGTLTDTQTLVLHVEQPLRIITVRLPDGPPNVLYDEQLEGQGGTGALFWEIVEYTLPPGLSLNSTTGDITGVPPIVGTWTFKVMLSDSDGHTVQKVFTIVIRPFSNKIVAGYCGGSAFPPQTPVRGLWALALAVGLLLIAGRRTQKGATS